MWYSARRLVIVLAVAGCAEIAVSTCSVMSGWAQEAPGETTGAAGAMSRDRVPPFLTDEERHRIYQGLMRFSDTPSKGSLDVADKVPASAPLQELPASLMADIPLLRGHKFMKLDDRILLVEPASRVVVAMIPRYKLLP